MLNALAVPACPDLSISNGIFYQNSIIDSDPIISVSLFSAIVIFLWPRLWLNDYVRKSEQANARRAHAPRAHFVAFQPFLIFSFIEFDCC